MKTRKKPHKGRDEFGRRLRWTRPQKKAAQEERQRKSLGRYRRPKSGELPPHLTPKNCGLTFWATMPVDVRDYILQFLEPKTRANLMTSSRAMQNVFGMRRIKKLRRKSYRAKVQGWREDWEKRRAREEKHQEVLEERRRTYWIRLPQALSYFEEHNLVNKEHGVSYKSVARDFWVSQKDLRAAHTLGSSVYTMDPVMLQNSIESGMWVNVWGDDDE